MRKSETGRQKDRRTESGIAFITNAGFRDGNPFFSVVVAWRLIF